MNESLYFEFFQTSDFDYIVNEFHSSLIDTNRGYKFFVDWNKIKRNINNYKIELNILNSLIGEKEFEKSLRNILTKYPEVLPVIPILIAVRIRNLKKKKLQVIKDFLDNGSDVIVYDFKHRELSEDEIDKFVLFFEKIGLTNFLVNMSQKSLYDYVMGVEVGMDTNARKNRSGKAMELLLKPIIEQIINQREKLQLYTQKTFGFFKGLGFDFKDDIRNRKGDFFIIKNDSKLINIEVNFFKGTGSKPQEIVDSYINRRYVLNSYGCNFIWITDGSGWKRQKNQIKNGFRKVDYLMNLSFVRDGLLERVLCQI